MLDSTTPHSPFNCPHCSTDLAREAFSFYLSGLIDGEGHFQLCRFGKCRQPRAEFILSLRADDRRILDSLRSFWGVGNMAEVDSDRYKQASAVKDSYRRNPSVRFFVSKTADLVRVVIPFFEAYPLRAKKAGDFTLWREGVLLRQDAMSRPYGLKWPPDSARRFDELIAAMKARRKYQLLDAI